MVDGEEMYRAYGLHAQGHRVQLTEFGSRASAPF
jgi:hypothetical protein